MKLTRKQLLLTMLAALLLGLAHGATINILPPATVAPPLPELMWQSFVSQTNSHPGKILTDVSDVEHPTWLTNALIYGLTGFTGIGYNFGSNNFTVPVTALTARHIYFRGHSAGASGWNDPYTNRHALFLTADNTLLKFAIKGAIVRFGAYTAGSIYTNNGVVISTNIIGDYSLAILDQDLPATITPLRIITPSTATAITYIPNPPWWGMHQAPEIGTDRFNNVGILGVDPLYKGGDSGSPNMWIIGHELFFLSGRTTSGWSTNLSNDLDALTRSQGLSPANYPLKFYTP